MEESFTENAAKTDGHPDILPEYFEYIQKERI